MQYVCSTTPIERLKLNIDKRTWTKQKYIVEALLSTFKWSYPIYEVAQTLFLCFFASWCSGCATTINTFVNEIFAHTMSNEHATLDLNTCVHQWLKLPVQVSNSFFVASLTHVYCKDKTKQWAVLVTCLPPWQFSAATYPSEVWKEKQTSKRRLSLSEWHSGSDHCWRLDAVQTRLWQIFFVNHTSAFDFRTELSRRHSPRAEQQRAPKHLISDGHVLGGCVMLNDSMSAGCCSKGWGLSFLNLACPTLVVFLRKIELGCCWCGEVTWLAITTVSMLQTLRLCALKASYLRAGSDPICQRLYTVRMSFGCCVKRSDLSTLASYTCFLDFECEIEVSRFSHWL